MYDMKPFCDQHHEEIEILCTYPTCPINYLCLLCFQDHSRICGANYKTDIKRLKHFDQNTIQPNNPIKLPLLTDIGDLWQQKRQVHDENKKIFSEQFTQIIRFMEGKYQAWSENLVDTADRLASADDHAIFSILSTYVENSRFCTSEDSYRGADQVLERGKRCLGK